MKKYFLLIVILLASGLFLLDFSLKPSRSPASKSQVKFDYSKLNGNSLMYFIKRFGDESDGKSPSERTEVINRIMDEAVQGYAEYGHDIGFDKLFFAKHGAIFRRQAQNYEALGYGNLKSFLSKYSYALWSKEYCVGGQCVGDRLRETLTPETIARLESETDANFNIRPPLQPVSAASTAQPSAELYFSLELDKEELDKIPKCLSQMSDMEAADFCQFVNDLFTKNRVLEAAQGSLSYSQELSGKTCLVHGNVRLEGENISQGRKLQNPKDLGSYATLIPKVSRLIGGERMLVLNGDQKIEITLFDFLKHSTLYCESKIIENKFARRPELANINFEKFLPLFLRHNSGDGEVATELVPEVTR